MSSKGEKMYHPNILLSRTNGDLFLSTKKYSILIFLIKLIDEKTFIK